MLKLHDSLTRKTAEFVPSDGKTFRVYACGPTVYHYAHIGNLRTFLVSDLLRRYLEYRGNEVKLVMNITDVGHMLNDADVGEDKMEAAAAKEGKTPQEIAAFYEKAFFDDIDRLGIERAWKYPRATEHVGEMVALVETLLDKGFAYATKKGDIYFDVSADKEYGKLSGNTVDKLVAGARVEVKEDKRNPADFALWISNPNHVLQWEGPRGIMGYPGWHLECSTMAAKYLGETIDLHIGGEDLKFPHHECEIAQSESASGKPFALRWLHVSYLLVEGEKMSKSKGNFYTLQDLIDKGFSPEAVRYLLLSSHYRSQLNFTMDGLKAAERAVEGLRDLAAAHASGDTRTGTPSDYERRFREAMDEDLNVSEALAVAHAFASDARNGKVSGADASRFLRILNDVFFPGLFNRRTLAIPPDVAALAEERKAARAGKRWDDSDRLRDEIAEKGFIVEDGPEGQRLRKK